MSPSSQLDKVGRSRVTSNRTITREFVLENELGLHFRPAAILVRELTPLECDVEVVLNGADAKANGKSVLELAILAAEAGSTLTFHINGKQAKEAMAIIERLFQERFGE